LNIYIINYMANILFIEEKLDHRPIDLEDFITMKGIAPFKEFRFMAKAINFGFLFGMIGKTFSDRELVHRWTEAQVDAYLSENKIINLVVDTEKKYRYELSKLECRYITVAEDIRKKFFDTYVGLESRITDMRKFFHENGFVRSYYGAFRKNSLVLMAGDEEDRKESSGQDNIVVNTTIQNFEAVVVMRNIVRISRWFRENRMQSRVIGTVHDSIDFYIEISEIPIVVPKIKEIFEELFKEFCGVPLTIECKLGDFYKDGKEI